MGEERRVLRVIDMRLDFVARTRPEVAHQGKQEAEELEEILALWNLARGGFENALDGVHDGGERIPHHEHADCDSADDEELKGLEENGQAAAFCEIAADQRAGTKQQSEDQIQGIPRRRHLVFRDSRDRAQSLREAEIGEDRLTQAWANIHAGLRASPWSRPTPNIPRSFATS